MIKKIIERLKPKPLIKIKDKNFDDLTLYELALLIEADSSLSQNGNKYFDSMALDEFLYSDTISRRDLKYLQKCIIRHIYIETGDNKKSINTSFLKQIANKLKNANDINEVLRWCKAIEQRGQSLP